MIQADAVYRAKGTGVPAYFGAPGTQLVTTVQVPKPAPAFPGLRETEWVDNLYEEAFLDVNVAAVAADGPPWYSAFLLPDDPRCLASDAAAEATQSPPENVNVRLDHRSIGEEWLTTGNTDNDHAVSLADTGFCIGSPAVGHGEEAREAAAVRIATWMSTVDEDGEPVAEIEDNDNRLTTEYEEPVWDSNPIKLEMIKAEDMSVRLKEFLAHCHDDTGMFAIWAYNLVGFHPSHTLADDLRKPEFPEWFPPFREFNQGKKNLWVTELWDEVVNLTCREYGTCVPRTQSARPPNNTMLMMMSKATYGHVDAFTYEKMITKLVFYGGGGPELVDNHDQNAVMHAAGAANTTFFKYFYSRASAFVNLGFDWNQKNDAGRNMRSLVNQGGSNYQISTWCEDLATRRLVSRDVFANDPKKPHRKGGPSKCNQRARSTRVVNPTPPYHVHHGCGGGSSSSRHWPQGDGDDTPFRTGN